MNVHMNGWTRALTTLLAAGAAGFLLWLAAQWDLHTTGGYWAAMGVVAGCGLLLGAAQLRGSGGNPRAMLLLGFLPVLVCAGWVLLYDQPHANWFRDHVTAWSSNIGILGVVRDVATWNGVLSFGIGLVFACALDLHLSPPRELAIIGPRDSDVARVALSAWDPRSVVAFGPSDEVPLLAGKELVDGRPAVYVCERFACRVPVTDPAGFARST